MKRIKYYYSAMSRQIFLILLMLFILARFVIFYEVIVFNINDYAASYNIGASIFLYIVYLVTCIFFFFGHRLFYTDYNENEVAYYNRILRKKYEMKIEKISKAILGKRGISLYTAGNEKSSLFIPFFRLGIVSPVGVDEFYKLLIEKNIPLEKQFTKLPGHGNSKKVLSLVYSCLALLILASLTQSVALARAIFISQP